MRNVEQDGGGTTSFKKLPSINLQNITQNSSKLDYQTTIQPPGSKFITDIRNNFGADHQAIKYRRKKGAGALREISALSQTIVQRGSLEHGDIGQQKRTPELFHHFNEDKRQQQESSIDNYRDNHSIESDIEIPMHHISINNPQPSRRKTLSKKKS